MATINTDDNYYLVDGIMNGGKSYFLPLMYEHNIKEIKFHIENLSIYIYNQQETADTYYHNVSRNPMHYAPNFKMIYGKDVIEKVAGLIKEEFNLALEEQILLKV
jgi:hypothetical protein